jgi:hypothetical protein
MFAPEQPRYGRCLEKGRGEYNSVWKVVSKRWIDTERQKMEENTREKRSIVLYNDLKSSWER